MPYYLKLNFVLLALSSCQMQSNLVLEIDLRSSILIIDFDFDTTPLLLVFLRGVSSSWSWDFEVDWNDCKKNIGKLIDVEQSEKTVTLITGEIVFSIMSNELSIYLIWILGSQLILSSNQSNATLWVWDTCLIVGLLSFEDIFEAVSKVSKILLPSEKVPRLWK